MSKKTNKQIILDAIHDLGWSLLYCDRAEDEDLSVEQLSKAIKDGTITIDEMVSEFKKSLKKFIPQIS